MFQNESEIMSFKNVPVRVAAAYLGCSLEFLRTGIESGTLPIGSCVKLSNNRRTFLISPERLIQFRTGKKE